MIRRNWKLFVILGVILMCYAGLKVYHSDVDISDISGVFGIGNGCHSFDKMSRMTEEALSNCDKNTLMSLIPVIRSDGYKIALYIKTTQPYHCIGTSIVTDFEHCGRPYLLAVRAESMLNDHSGRR